MAPCMCAHTHVFVAHIGGTFLIHSDHAHLRHPARLADGRIPITCARLEQRCQSGTLLDCLCCPRCMSALAGHWLPGRSCNAQMPAHIATPWRLTFVRQKCAVQEHQSMIREWALQARSICMQRLRLTPSPHEATDPEVGNFIHDSMAMDEGARLQARKDKLIFHAETIIDLADIVGGKLEVIPFIHASVTASTLERKSCFCRSRKAAAS
jgi:hypothetical protein